MTAIQMGCARPVPGTPGCMGGIAFDGCGYVLLDGRCCSVIKLDCELRQVETVRTARPYTNICYDERECCFWASAAGSPAVLYQLDLCFCEVEKLQLTGACRHCLYGMSCDPCSGELLLVFSDSIERVNTHTGATERLPGSGYGKMNLGVLALCGGYLVSYLKGERQYIDVECPGCGDRTGFCVPEDYNLCAMVLHKVCCEEGTGCVTNEVGLFLTERCSGELVLMEGVVRCCAHVCPPHPPIPPCQGVYEIMHSVALEEAGIAHILNAEGEKLQKAVAESTSIQELLCVNESVRRTITQITLLEGQLYSKLEAVCGCCDEPCDKP